MKRIVIFCITFTFLTGYAQKSDFCITYPSGRTLCYTITSPNTVKIGKSNNKAGLTYDREDYLYRYSIEGSLSIPATVTDRGDTYAITYIDNLEHTNLTSVTLSENVTIIGNHAFWHCEKLTNINFPNSLESIYPCAFENCSSLRSIKIPSGVRVIGRRAFKESGLTSVNIPATVEQIGRSTFGDCHNLQNATVSCKLILGTEDRGCRSGRYNDNYVYGNGDWFYDDYTYVSYVGGSFENCENLQKVTLTPTVTHIGARTFRGCSSLREIVIPESVTYIGWNAFGNCTSLRDIVIPEGVVSLGKDAFAGCRRLRTVKLPSSLSTLIDSYERNGHKWEVDNYGNDMKDKGMFYDCVSLEKIIIPVGTYEKFARMLPEYKAYLVEEE